MTIKRYAVVVDWYGNGGTELREGNLPRRRAVTLAKEIAGRNARCLRYQFDLETGRRRRPRFGTTIYFGDSAWVMVEALP